MARFTTSAQKTLTLTREEAFRKLEEAISKDIGLTFVTTKDDYIKSAKLPDRSTFVIAAFKKENGKSLAMIDFKNVPGEETRLNIQQSIRQKLNDVFKVP